MAVQRLAGFREGFQPVMDDAPYIGKQDIDAVSDVPQTIDKAQAGHDAQLARSGGAAHQRSIAGDARRRLRGFDAARSARSAELSLDLSLGFLRVTTLCRAGTLGAHRTRRGEQEALAEADIIVEQVDHRAFALDTLGNQVDAEAAEQIGEGSGMNVRGRALFRIEQERRRYLYVADAAIGQFPRLDPQIRDMVH